MATFAGLLAHSRRRSGLSQRELATASGVNPAIICRMERGERGPSGPTQVLAIARALRLDAQETDELLASAGLWPDVYRALGPDDPTLLAVARILASAHVTAQAKARLRSTLALLTEQWLDDASGGPATAALAARLSGPPAQ